MGAVMFYVSQKIIKKINKDDAKIITFGALFFITALLPFLGLGNISSRYSYLATFGLVLLLAFLIKKLFEFLLVNGRAIASVSIIAALLIFSFAHLLQSQKIHEDWRIAGEKSKNFLISFSSIYSDDWKKDDMQFYFVNVPIRHGDAWIFPVGLSDAVWFILRNPAVSVSQSPTLTQALDAAESFVNARVFLFDNDGTIVSVVRSKETGAVNIVK